MTDRKGRRARGWLFFDADCAFCTALARRFRRPLEARGYGLAALQDPRVQALLGLPQEQHFAEMRLLAPDGDQLGGADAVIYLARLLWWAWPLYLLSRLPGMRLLLRAGYRWFATRRRCTSSRCLPDAHHLAVNALRLKSLVGEGQGEIRWGSRSKKGGSQL